MSRPDNWDVASVLHICPIPFDVVLSAEGAFLNAQIRIEYYCKILLIVI